MRAVTFEAPGEVRVVDKPEPELIDPGDAIVRVELAAVCGSDLHIYHGRVKVEQGFTLGHEWVGTVVDAGAEVARVSVGDRVLGCFCDACGACFFCTRGDFHRCVQGKAFGHGSGLGDLPGTQADLVRVPHADIVLRQVPDGMSDDVAIFAGDVMGTGFHGAKQAGVQSGQTIAVLGLGPVGLCSVQAALALGAENVVAVDTVADRLALAEAFGATAVHLTDGDPKAVARELTGGRGADATIDAVGDPRAFELAVRMTRDAGTVAAVGVYAERQDVHLGLIWIKALTIRGGQANVVAHVDEVLELLAAGTLDPTPMITHHLPLDDAAEAYALADSKAALKALLVV